MRNRLWCVIAVSCCFLSTPLLAEAPSAPLQLTVSGSTVQIANVTAGKSVLLFAATLTGNGGLLRQGRVCTLLNADADGNVVYTHPTEIPLRSIWIAIDVTSGRHVIAGRADYPVQIVSPPGQFSNTNSIGTSDLLDPERSAALMALVRPGVGAWLILGVAGTDSFGARTPMRLSLKAARLLGDEQTPAPSILQEGDIVSVIDPTRMETYLVEVAR